MGKDATMTLSEILQQDEAVIFQQWLDRQLNAPGLRTDRISRHELTEQSRRFLGLLRDAARDGGTDIHGSAWGGVRQLLDELSLARAQQGFSPSETAMFVFSLKEALFERLRARNESAEITAATIWHVTTLLDRLGLYTTEVFQKGREQVIVRQQQELMELSTPVVTLWEGVLALPIIGTLDSARTQVVMESLLQRIVDSGASIAIIDITGVPTVDTLVGAAPAEDGRGGAAHGSRLHHQRHPPADRADHRASRRRAGVGGHQGDARRRVRHRHPAARPERAEDRDAAAAPRPRGRRPRGRPRAKRALTWNASRF